MNRIGIALILLSLSTAASGKSLEELANYPLPQWEGTDKPPQQWCEERGYLATGWQIRKNAKTGNYKELFTKEGRLCTGRRGTYLKDIHVWVYTPEFAEKFGMPEEWIDKRLKGAEALALRKEYDTRQYCGYFGEVENCSPRSYCMLDVYLKKEVSEQLPWRTDADHGKVPMSKDNSGYWTWPQKKEYAPGWDPEAAKRGVTNIHKHKVRFGYGIRGVYTRKSKEGWGQLAGGGVMEFDKRVYANVGLDYLSFGAGGLCGSRQARYRRDKIRHRITENRWGIPNKKSVEELEFHNPLVDKYNYYIQIPDGFLYRVELYIKGLGEKSLYQELKERNK